MSEVENNEEFMEIRLAATTEDGVLRISVYRDDGEIMLLDGIENPELVAHLEIGNNLEVFLADFADLLLKQIDEDEGNIKDNEDNEDN